MASAPMAKKPTETAPMATTTTAAPINVGELLISPPFRVAPRSSIMRRAHISIGNRGILFGQAWRHGITARELKAVPIRIAAPAEARGVRALIE